MSPTWLVNREKIHLLYKVIQVCRTLLKGDVWIGKFCSDIGTTFLYGHATGHAWNIYNSARYDKYLILFYFILFRPFTDFWVVSIEHLRRVCNVDRGRLLIRRPGPVPLGLAYVLLVETNPFPELVVIFPDYDLRISLGTFSILLYCFNTLMLFIYRKYLTYQ